MLKPKNDRDPRVVKKQFCYRVKHFLVAAKICVPIRFDKLAPARGRIEETRGRLASNNGVELTNEQVQELQAEYERILNRMEPDHGWIVRGSFNLFPTGNP